MKIQKAMGDFKELLCVTPQIKIESSIETCAAICRTHECWQLLTPTVRAEIFYEHISNLHKGLIDKVELSKALELRNAQSCVKSLEKQLVEFKIKSRIKIEEKDEEILKIQTHVEWLEELACKIDAIEIIESLDDSETLLDVQNKPVLGSETNGVHSIDMNKNRLEENSQKIINVVSSSDINSTVPGSYQDIFIQNFKCQKCFKICSSVYHLRWHIKVEHFPTFPCKVPGCSFVSRCKSTHLRHLKLKHKNVNKLIKDINELSPDYEKFMFVSRK